MLQNIRLEFLFHFLKLVLGHVTLTLAEALQFLAGCVEIWSRRTWWNL